MEFQRTPDHYFENLADYSFSPHYCEIDDTEGGRLRLHYLDEGDPNGSVVLLMHGQPAWSYLYRLMIPSLVEAGHRVIAPDLIGFGRSDKPTKPTDYTYGRHVAWMSDWLTQLDLQDITVFFQDWGSLIGLRLVTAFPERFSRVVLANGALPAGPIPMAHVEMIRAAYDQCPVVSLEELGRHFVDPDGLPGIFYWRKFCAQGQEISQPGDVIASISQGGLTNEARRAFNAPFPDESYVAGARRFPSLIPLLEDEPEVAENRAAWEMLAEFDKPFLLAFADNDPVTAGADQQFLSVVPGCQGLPHRTIAPAGHFLQQEQPAQCVQAILDVMALPT